MKIAKLAAFGAAMMLAGCAGMNEAMTYNGHVTQVAMPDDTYRVMEKPDHSSVMTTPSIGTAMGTGFKQGLTLGIVRDVPPLQRHEAAARKYLDDSGRANCQLTNGREILEGQDVFDIVCPKDDKTPAS